MIKDLGWATLETRRRQSRLMLTCMYELTHGLIDIDTRVPYADKGVLKFSFFPKTIADWNCLLEAIVSYCFINFLRIVQIWLQLF